LADLLWNKNKNTYDFFDSEPDDYLFNKSIMSNSKGVVRFPRQCGIDGNINVTFSLQGIE
jgi:N-acetylneuraminic acid mutarotase